MKATARAQERLRSWQASSNSRPSTLFPKLLEGEATDSNMISTNQFKNVRRATLVRA